MQNNAALLSALAGLLLLVGAHAQAACSNVTITHKAMRKGNRTKHTVDPWISPSTNTTNRSLPPGVCPFSSYPTIYATCKDHITFVTRAIPGGARAHGTYLLNDMFVNQTTGAFHCPSTAMDVDLRNTTVGYTNVGACRAEGLVRLGIDGTSNLTAPFKADPTCSGYTVLDPLKNFVPTAPVNCSTATSIYEPLMGNKPSCYQNDSYTIDLRRLVKTKNTTKYLVFACPAIGGNQPGGTSSHCHGRMTVVVRVTC